MPMPEVSGKRILPNSFGKLALNSSRNFLLAFGAGFELDAGVDVFGVLAEDHHVDFSGFLTGEGTPLNQRTGRRQT